MIGALAWIFHHHQRGLIGGGCGLMSVGVHLDRFVSFSSIHLYRERKIVGGDHLPFACADQTTSA